MTFNLHDLLVDRAWKDSAILEFFFGSRAVVEPLATPFEPAKERIECLSTCSRKSFLMNSLTRTMSGAYGEVPLNAKRAVTSCSAANARSAVRSTIATTLPCEDTSCEYAG